MEPDCRMADEPASEPSRHAWTEQWLAANTFASDNSAVLSPVSNLTFQLSSQTLNETPRRRLSLDSASNSEGTPNYLFSSGLSPECILQRNPAISRIEPSVTVSLASPTNRTSNSSENGGLSSDVVGSINLLAPQRAMKRKSGITCLNHPALLIVDGTSAESPAPIASLSSKFLNFSSDSPCPSSVFLPDEDSQDSGFSDSQEILNKTTTINPQRWGLPATETLLFACPTLPAPRMKHKISSPAVFFSTIKEQSDDGFCDISPSSDWNAPSSINDLVDSSDFSKLLSCSLLCQNSRNNAGKDTTFTDPIHRTAVSDSDAPSKHLFPIRRVTSSLTCLGGKRTQRSPESPSECMASAGMGKRRKPSNETSSCLKDTSNIQPPKFHRCYSETEAGIALALQKSATVDNLIGDFSTTHALPLYKLSKHNDLNAISSQTAKDLLDGLYTDSVTDFALVDCRYPYEYEAGHIKNAFNIFAKGQLAQEYLSEAGLIAAAKRVLIFYCEFSSERGPSMARYLRSHDRKLNRDNYPRLHYPEIYILDGGYKGFFETFREYCDPPDYKTMLDKQHADDLRHFRIKSKSWAGPADDSVSMRTSRPAARVGLRFQ